MISGKRSIASFSPVHTKKLKTMKTTGTWDCARVAEQFILRGYHHFIHKLSSHTLVLPDLIQNIFLLRMTMSFRTVLELRNKSNI